MAFFFLFTGLLVGASLVNLSESERDYYYSNRSMYMTYLGNRDGVDVYKDNLTGQYYVDDGWDVSRVGTSGFTAHPVDRERLRQLCTKYNPSNVPWVDFLLASFEGREQSLWRNFFEKYELGPKPKEPTWGKGIRKTRWAKYEEDLQTWEAKRALLTPQFEEECRRWDEKRRNYDGEYQAQVSQAAGQALLKRALSSPTVIIQAPVVTSAVTTYKAVVPAGAKPGDNFMVNAGGQMMSVRVPPGAYGGKEITFQAPLAQAPIPAQVVQAVPMTTPPPAYSAAPPATATSTPASAPPSVPPALGTGAAPPVQKQSSISFRNTTTGAVVPPPPAISGPVPAAKEANQNMEKKSSMIW